jgi:hypothetical protein
VGILNQTRPSPQAAEDPDDPPGGRSPRRRTHRSLWPVNLMMGWILLGVFIVGGLVQQVGEHLFEGLGAFFVTDNGQQPLTFPHGPLPGVLVPCDLDHYSSFQRRL